MLYAVAFRYYDREYYGELSAEKELSFGCHKKDTVQIPASEDHLLVLKLSAGGISAMMYKKYIAVELNRIIDLDEEHGVKLYISRITGESTVFLNLPYNGRVSCGRGKANDIIVTFPFVSRRHFLLTCEAGQVHVEDLDSTNHLYLNGKRISKSVMRSGDILSIYTLHFVIRNGVLYFRNIGDALKVDDSLESLQKIPEAEKISTYSVVTSEKKNAHYLYYHLSPRVREQMPHEPIILSPVPAHGASMGGRRGNAAYMISSGAMLAASLATGMISPAALLSRAVGMISPITNMAMYGKMSKEEKKQLEEYEKLRQERYQTYIADQKARINKIADIQRRIVTNENQSPDQCMLTVREMKRSLWERMSSDTDFLLTRLGIGKQRLCVEVKSHRDEDAFRMEDDELDQLAEQIIEETSYVDNIPVCVPLKNYQTVGIIGPREKRFYLLRSMLVELTSQHNYKDLRLVCFFDEEEKGVWGILRWLPHIWDETGQVRYISFDEERRHTLCEMMSDMIRHRKAESQMESQKQNRQFFPHYIIIVQNQELLYKEAIYDDLVSNSQTLGITAIFLSDTIYNLPQTSQYLIDLTGKPYAYEREKFDERVFFSQDGPVHQAELESFCRLMAAVELEEKGRKTAIPSTISFLQGYKVETVEQLAIWDRWKHSEPYRTLAAPIGVMEGGKIFSLDVRSGESSHGPHGLLAGTTGSGKSELLQTWILSMAVNYHPHDVNFVIIDYKGGGMSDLLEPLPHVVGKITNIDQNISRSLISLKNELKRRQKIFARAGVNNIDKYQNAYQRGETSERLPHLIIVTDEFAEMKKEEPEFMTELNSIATVGRSLGVHLLLATQKPAGVVTDQINSNSRFRICMKVQDVSDSREMIKRSDAAKITQAGRAYIRVGEDEIFELFQSFFSGAEYSNHRTSGIRSENQVRIVGVTGNRINLSAGYQKKVLSEKDELHAIIEYMNQICTLHGIQKMPAPWLPELPGWLSLEELETEKGFDGTGWTKRGGLAVPVGRYDAPSLQAQGIQYVDFLKIGNYGVFGAPLTGKTTLLKTVLVSLCMHYTPADVELYVIDAGNWSLKEFAVMPHVREVILNQEEERLKTCVVSLRKQLEKRKKRFLEHSVSSFLTYKETVSEELSAIVIIVDQIDKLFGQYPELDEIITEIASAGAAYGMFLMFSANSYLGIRYKFMQLIKGMIALQMTDKGDYSSLVGPTVGVSLPNMPGRGLMKGNPPVLFQTAFYAKEREEQSRAEEISHLAEQMRAAWIPSVLEPEKEISLFEQFSLETNGLLVGSDAKTGKPIRILLRDPYIFLVSSNSTEKNRTILEKLKKMVTGGGSEIIWADQTNGVSILEKLIEEFEKRRKSYQTTSQMADFEEKKWISQYRQICLFIEDIGLFAAGLSKETQKGYARIFKKATGLGLMVFVGGRNDDLSIENPELLIHTVIQAQNMLVFDGCVSDYPFIQCELEPFQIGIRLEKAEAALVYQGKLTLIRF